MIVNGYRVLYGLMDWDSRVIFVGLWIDWKFLKYKLRSFMLFEFYFDKEVNMYNIKVYY